MTDSEFTPDEEKMFIALYGKDYFLELKMPKKTTARAYLMAKKKDYILKKIKLIHNQYMVELNTKAKKKLEEIQITLSQEYLGYSV